MKKLVKIQKNRGMSYIELIVVLGIFSVMTSVTLFNYGKFQAKVDIKNLASDIALKVVEAQKTSLSGKLPIQTATIADPTKWKPSYGVFYFNPAVNSKSFIYFTDLNQDGFLPSSAINCPPNDECLDKITITKKNSISNLDVFYQNNTTASLIDLVITFKRPDSRAIIKSSSSLAGGVIDYVQITIVSPQTATAKIKIYPSGRIQIN